MRELSLFSGAGGGLLASKLLGWETIGYVEFNDYCQRVIAQRIEDGLLDRAPIFTDIRAFAGIAHHYRGFVDVVSGGFPCQPFSVAGKQQAENDPRNMWPATLDVIRSVRPRYCFLENVPGLLSQRYIQRIFGDLAEAGYDAKWCVLGADDCGAPHQRKRLWIKATNTSEQFSDGREDNARVGAQSEASPKFRDSGWPDDVANTNSAQRERVRITKRGQKERADIGMGGWWQTEPELGRVANGVANRVDRLKAIGNGQVSSVAATAWRLLK